jgi:predicted porin
MKVHRRIDLCIGTLALTGAFLLGTISPAKAEHAILTSAGDDMKVVWYGQINRMLMSVDDGNETTFAHVDNDLSSTRIGVKIKAKLTDSFTAGGRFEAELQSNPSNEINQIEFKGVDGDFNLRHADVFLGGRWGKLSIGQGDTASNGTSEADLSGTMAISYSYMAGIAGGFYFFDRNVQGISRIDMEGNEEFNPRVKDSTSNMCGLSRDDRLRYDAPSLAGMNLSASIMEEDVWDIAFRYNGAYDSGMKVKVEAAYADGGENKSWDSQVDGSVSVLLGMGLNFTFAAGQQMYDGDEKADDPFFWYGKIGYTRKFTDIGPTSFSFDYSQTNDLDEDGDEGTAYGIQAVQKIERLGTEIYAGARSYALDRSGYDFEDISVLAAGARIKF